MAEISELEHRIKTALDRIGAGVEKLAETPPDTAATGALEEALETEKMANAQLEERLRALREAHGDEVRELKASTADKMDQLEADLARLGTEASEAKAQVRALRQSNQRLQASLATLREAGTDGVEPHLINHAMMSELEALRAARAAEQSELDEILGALKPMLQEEGPNA